MKIENYKQFAGIQYVGIAGISRECKIAVMRLIECGVQINNVHILTFDNTHCLMLDVNVGDMIAVKSGFSSGYLGEGPAAFSYVLQLLESKNVDIDEYDVSEDMKNRLDRSCLTRLDLEQLDEMRPVRPHRWYKYILQSDFDRNSNTDIWSKFDPIIPLGIIDSRIIDLAITFWDDADAKLLSAYRRLEDIIRKKTDLDEHGAKLFSQAFHGDDSKLEWTEIDGTEQKGRANLFTGAYMAHRNPRAHREVKNSPHDQLREFLVLNHLYILEAKSKEREIKDTNS